MKTNFGDKVFLALQSFITGIGSRIFFDGSTAVFDVKKVWFYFCRIRDIAS